MKIKVISSGSKGNSTFIESNGTRILVDVGITFQTIKSSLEEIGENVYNIDAVLVSHQHHDHISGLASLCKKLNVPVFIKKELESEVKKLVNNELINIIGDSLKIGNLDITIFNNSHDVPNFGYIFNDDENSLVYITDTGYVNRKIMNITMNKSVYIIESNHDEEMLMNGPYPYILKQRVLSDSGHLSNKSATTYLKKVIGDNTKYIILAHISENNNTYDLAYENATNELKDKFDKDNIIVAYQRQGAKLIEI